MDSQNKVSLKKNDNSWTDPVTGEIYPGGMPVQQTMQQPAPQQMIQQPTYNNIQQNPFPQQLPNQNKTYQAPPVDNLKFCKYCGGRIPMEAVLCTLCGRQVEQLQVINQNVPTQIIVNNSNNNNINMRGTPKDKWIAFLLCTLLGSVGAHKFYEGRIGMGILYLLTGGLFLIGAFIDWIIILTKPNPYYV